jgi:YidC/Oxa1 family membrane protein insertase
MLITIFNKILYQPLFNVLILLYQYLPGRDFGLAVIVLTILIRILLYPLVAQSIKTQKIFSQLQPKIEEIQKKYKGDKKTQLNEIMALYQKEKINPLSNFIPLLIQFPILVALYQVFWKGLQPQSMEALYSFIPCPDKINPALFGLIDLSKGNGILAILAGIFQFFQSKMAFSFAPQQKPENQFSQIIQKEMLYLFPIFTVFILWKLPSAIALYWLVTILFSIFQQYLILKPEYEKRGPC